MKDRIREIRESMKDEHGKKLTQEQFAKKIGVSVSTAQKWEIGASKPTSTAIQQIADKCGASELWLRTGIGSRDDTKDRAEELSGYVKRLVNDKPKSFQTALVATLLRFDPDGPEWEILERIYNSIAKELENGGK